jgi:molecular chaperone HtpG
VVRRSLDLLGRLAKDDDPAKFHQLWDNFGMVLKEGIVEDQGNRDKIAALLRFTSTHEVAAGQRTSLADYIGRMAEGQDTIWYITAESLNAAKHSPHLEVFRKKGVEVLLMSDRIDEWMMGYFHEFEGKKLKSVAKGEVSLDDSETPAQDSETDSDLLQRMQAVLEGAVEEVRASRRLTDSASCLVLGEHDMALHLRRMLEQAGQQMPDSLPALEVNLQHPLLQRLAATADEAAFADWTRLVHEQAILAEGGQLDDPAAFVQRLNRLMLAA